MKRITVSYVYYFNKKYKRIGHLFQDRFKSENIENDVYLLEAVRYIHNNPVKAGMVKTPLEYRWSSFNNYIKSQTTGKVISERVLDMFSKRRLAAVEQFLEFSSKFGEVQFIEYENIDRSEKRGNQEQDARGCLQEMLYTRGLKLEDLHCKENSVHRNEVVGSLKGRYDLSIRQMEKITGINRGTIMNLYKKGNIVDSENRPL
jgi:putative transposase